MRGNLIQFLLLIAAAVFALWLGSSAVSASDAGMAVVVGVIAATAGLWLVGWEALERKFLIRLYLGSLLIRVLVGSLITRFNMQGFFGADASTYDAFGEVLYNSWIGLVDPNALWLTHLTGAERSGWGYYYFVAAIYYLIGKNPLAIQYITCVMGAIAAVLAFKISILIHPNRRIARMAALFTAFSPSMILWSSQMLRDGPIVLCLCLCTYYTLKLREEFELRSAALLILSLFCLYALRHYVSYILFVAIAGTFLLGSKQLTPLRVIQGAVLVIILGLTLAYFGAGTVIEKRLDLETIQRGREWSANVAASGFGGDVDITDPEAAAGFLPIGILYVLFAPFPWMVINFRQLVTLPELLVWWALFPTMLSGFWFAVKHKLRECLGISIFTVGLTLVYALFQTNVGTAYRHRAQIYVFFFIFIAIGFELRRERRLARSGPLRRAPAAAVPVAARF